MYIPVVFKSCQWKLSWYRKVCEALLLLFLTTVYVRAVTRVLIPQIIILCPKYSRFCEILFRYAKLLCLSWNSTLFSKSFESRKLKFFYFCNFDSKIWISVFKNEPSNEPVFHKFYLVHSWIHCLIYHYLLLCESKLIAAAQTCSKVRYSKNLRKISFKTSMVGSVKQMQSRWCSVKKLSLKKL